MKLNKTMIAHRYGSALFELALEKSERQDLKKELVELKQVLVNEPNMMLLLTSKQILKLTNKNLSKFWVIQLLKL